MRMKQGDELSRRETSLLVLVWIYRVLMVALVAGGLCWPGLLPAPLKAKEMLVTLAGYTGAMVVLQGIYRACGLGQVHLAELVMSQVLTDLVSMALLYIGLALYDHALFSVLPLLAVLLAQILLGCIWSLSANHLYFKNRRPSRALVIYKGEENLQKLYETPHFHAKYEVCKTLCDPADDIASLRRELEGCEVVFTIGVPATLTNGIAKLCVEMDVRGYFVPHLGSIILAGAEYISTFSIPMLRVRRAGGHSEYRMLKRGFDFIVALLGVILTSPIMAVTAAAIKLEDGGPVLYRQIRLTRNGRRFSILKFRSMTVNAEKDGVARLAGQNDSRITKVGRFIRACRIDELPQLINILRGDMSLVGPRPERPEIAAKYEEKLPEFSLRLQVKAGLTGMAQVYGRYNTEPYNKLQMDLMYINEMSMLKDLQLILTTIKILFMKESTEGVGAEQAAARGMTAPEHCDRPA